MCKKECEDSEQKLQARGRPRETIHIFHVCLRRLGVPPRPPLTEMKDRRATVTDVLQSTTFRLYSSAAAPVTGAAAPAGTPAASVPSHKVQARHALYFEIRNRVCVCFITAGPITKLFAWGEEESGGHVL